MSRRMEERQSWVKLIVKFYFLGATSSSEVLEEERGTETKKQKERGMTIIIILV